MNGFWSAPGFANGILWTRGWRASDLAVGAARDLAARHNVDLSTVEAIIVGTVTPDMMYPVDGLPGAEEAGRFRRRGDSISHAGCSGFVFSLTTGVKLVESGAHKKVLVIGADVNSSMIDYTDRATCILFGDGAGAVLLEPAEDGEAAGLYRLSCIRWRATAGNICTSPAAGVCILRRTRRWTRRCIMFIRMGSRSSSMR